MTSILTEWPFENGQTEKPGHRMAAEAMQFPVVSQFDFLGA